MVTPGSPMDSYNPKEPYGNPKESYGLLKTLRNPTVLKPTLKNPMLGLESVDESKSDS